MLSGSQVNGFDILIASIVVSRQVSGILTRDLDFKVITPVADLGNAEPIKSQFLLLPYESESRH